MRARPAPVLANVEALNEFVGYASTLRGDEKAEAQTFLDRLFRAFGHAGWKEAGAELEARVRAKGRSTRFIDLLWAPRVLIEMKRRGEDLDRHYDQARDYWHDTYPKPRYVVLCNFDVFRVYDFFQQSDPVDEVRLGDLPARHMALAFLLPEETRPQFGNDRVEVSRKAADAMAGVFQGLISRGEDRALAQRFSLQCVFCLFAEDLGLLPRGLFAELIHEAREGASAHDLFGALFRQMASPERARGGRFRRVDYFNGGLFERIDPIDLARDELDHLAAAAGENWAKVQPPIFGALFEGSLDKGERHALGAHFTSEADILKVVRPTIERPWIARIDAARTLKELLALREALLSYRVLDPACGCGNFLYVAYRALRALEMRILSRVHAEFGDRARLEAGTRPLVSLRQMFGIDVNSFAVELTKVTLVLGREQVIAETQERMRSGQLDLPLEMEPALPLDNLESNIVLGDALLGEWPEADAIIGNPPFQSKNKIQRELGPEVLGKVRARWPEVPGRADYCVYWFNRAHRELKPGGRAGLVGTNTIRQNYSRQGGLDRIVADGGTIVEAVATQPWSGEANVHVSIVNWVKGDEPGKKLLVEEVGSRGRAVETKRLLDRINSSLSATTDVSGARALRVNRESGVCFQGQTHGHEGFLLSPDEAKAMIRLDPENRKVLFPYMTGDELIGSAPPRPRRWVIDFHPRDVLQAGRFKEPFRRVKEKVYEARVQAARAESERNRPVLEKARAGVAGFMEGPRVNRHHANFLNQWWLFSYARAEMIRTISRRPRFLACCQVMKRSIFEFVCRSVRPNAALMVFALSDDYSFGILQSGVHREWFFARCSTLCEDHRYTSNTVFDSFPWPQSPKLRQARAVARAAARLRELRRRILAENDWSLRDLYRTLDADGSNPLREAHEALDAAVRDAYGMTAHEDSLAFLRDLNGDLAAREEAGETSIVGPGLPPCVKDPEPFVTRDCIGPDGPRA